MNHGSNGSEAAAHKSRGETMAEMWDGFAKGALPYLAADEFQYIEMQKAFYCGAMCLFDWFMSQLGEGGESTAGNIVRVDSLGDEIAAYIKTIARTNKAND